MPTKVIVPRAVAERDLARLLTELPSENRMEAAQAIIAWIFREENFKGRGVTNLTLPYSPSFGSDGRSRHVTLYVNNVPVMIIARDSDLVAITA